jgi:DNA-binding LacI/PurR family transcriptional regulator
MDAHGLKAEARVLAGGLTRLEGYTAARTMIDDPRLPTAVIGFNDEVRSPSSKHSYTRDIVYRRMFR